MGDVRITYRQTKISYRTLPKIVIAYAENAHIKLPFPTLGRRKTTSYMSHRPNDSENVDKQKFGRVI